MNIIDVMLKDDDRGVGVGEDGNWQAIEPVQWVALIYDRHPDERGGHESWLDVGKHLCSDAAWHAAAQMIATKH